MIECGEGSVWCDVVMFFIGLSIVYWDGDVFVIDIDECCVVMLFNVKGWVCVVL